MASFISRLEEIQDRFDDEEFDKAIIIIDELLKEHKNDVDLVQMKAYGLVQEDRIQECLCFINKLPAELKACVPEEYQYCLFSKRAFVELNHVLASVDDLSEFQHYLYSQSLYKAESFDAAAEHLQAAKALTVLDPEDEDDEELANEIIANELAITVASGCEREKLEAMRSQITSSDMFEVLFNFSTGLLDRGDLPAAKKMLQHTEEAAREILQSHDMSDREITAELFPIEMAKAVLAHTALLMGAIDGDKKASDVVQAVGETYRKAVYYGARNAHDVAVANAKVLRSMKEHGLHPKLKRKTRKNPAPKHPKAAEPDPRRWMPKSIRAMKSKTGKTSGTGAQGIEGRAEEIKTVRRDDAKMRQAMRAAKGGGRRIRR
ncbi:hypothetical protein J8273_3106 [Carpediemonas membranifera]|uniref:Uncharacterized protein n=1 Tax=Carpediemonas membranifera TaxID=201153 RepID=A0A8J6EAW2_9EUKA|nr:hypothetical protein J8273_3106 [Carpediemonas membranifera]|eukprot:KAG9395530.1 hypothetical protein J8273_3106 [Carpediemonas membranifera]